MRSGPEHSILMSDAGQRHNPMPAECLRVFAQSVYESGISEEGVERMIKRQPARPARAGTAPRAARATGAGRTAATTNGASGADGHVALSSQPGE